MIIVQVGLKQNCCHSDTNIAAKKYKVEQYVVK